MQAWQGWRGCCLPCACAARPGSAAALCTYALTARQRAVKRALDLVLDNLASYLRDGLVVASGGGPDGIVNVDQLEQLFGAPAGEDGMYVRSGEDPRAYAARGGALEDLQSPGRWLGLDFFALDPSAVVRAQIAPASGQGYRLQRDSEAARNFSLAEPSGWQLITAGAGNGVATAGARVRFRDVRREGAEPGTPSAAHAAVTASGLAYAYTFYEEGGEIWATLDVSPVQAEAADRAERFNAFTEGWMFQLSEDAYERMTRPLNRLAEPVAQPRPAQDAPQP